MKEQQTPQAEIEKGLIEEFHRLCRLFALGRVELWEVQAVGQQIVKIRRGF